MKRFLYGLLALVLVLLLLLEEERLLYGLRLWCYFAVHGDYQKNITYPFSWYFQMYDRRREHFAWARGETQ